MQVRALGKYRPTLMTHTFDATGRQPVLLGTRGYGPDEYALQTPEVYCELISDSCGIHVHPEMQRLLLQSKGADKVVLITDCTVSVGANPPALAHIIDLNFDHNSDLCGSRLTLDQRVNVLRFDREGAESVVLVNYGVHTDTVNGELLSADWPAWMAKTLDKALDGVKCMFICGAQGDVGSTNVHPSGGDMNDTEISFDNEMKSPGMARFVGRALAGTVLQVYDKVQYVEDVDISITNDYIRVPSNMPTPEQMPLAKEYKAYHDAGRDDLIPYTAMELTTVVEEALRMCDLEHGPVDFEVRLTGLKLGPVAMVGIPGEPFTDVGVAIKDTPGWDLILPCGLTNGYMGYFPMQSAFDEGGYEARTSRFRGGVAERIIQGSKNLLGKMK